MIQDFLGSFDFSYLSQSFSLPTPELDLCYQSQQEILRNILPKLFSLLQQHKKVFRYIICLWENCKEAAYYVISDFVFQVVDKKKIMRMNIFTFKRAKNTLPEKSSRLL